MLYNALKDISEEAYNNKLVKQIYGQSHACRLKTADGRVTHYDPNIQV